MSKTAATSSSSLQHQERKSCLHYPVLLDDRIARNSGEFQKVEERERMVLPRQMKVRGKLRTLRRQEQLQWIVSKEIIWDKPRRNPYATLSKEGQGATVHQKRPMISNDSCKTHVQFFMPSTGRKNKAYISQKTNDTCKRQPGRIFQQEMES